MKEFQFSYVSTDFGECSVQAETYEEAEKLAYEEFLFGNVAWLKNEYEITLDATYDVEEA